VEKTNKEHGRKNMDGPSEILLLDHNIDWPIWKTLKI